MDSELQRRKSVLVVEDEAMVSLLLVDMLKEMGCTIAGVATNLDQALSLAQTLEIDFAVLDLNLDGQFALPVADVLAKRGVPIIFSTGYGEGALPERFETTPALHKPFQIHDLERAIHTALQTANGSQE